MNFVKIVAPFALYCNETGFSLCPSSLGFLQAGDALVLGGFFVASCLVWVLLLFFGWLVLWGQWVYTAHVAASFLLQTTPAKLISLLKAFSFWLEDKRDSKGCGKGAVKDFPRVEHPQGMGIDLNSLNPVWRAVERVTWFFSPSNCCASSIPSDTPSHYKTKAKDGYRLLVMAKNITMLNQFNWVITTFIISKSIFFLYSHQFSRNLKDLSSFFFLNFSLPNWKLTSCWLVGKIIRRGQESI